MITNFVSDCFTKEGQTCVFPFKNKGISYNGCTSADYDQLWCSTKNGADGNYETWDVCTPSCKEGQ